VKLEEFDAELAFNAAFQQQVDERIEFTGFPVQEFRAAGRATKEWPNKEDAAFWLTKGPEWVRQYIDWRDGSPWQIWQTPFGEPAIELALEVPIGGVTVKAIIDRIFETPSGELVVVDLKSGSRNPDSSLQLGFYAAAVEATFDRRPEWGSYYAARKAQLLPLVSLDHYTEHLLGGILRRFVKACEDDIFIPQPGGHCNSCGVARGCAIVGGVEAPLYDPLHHGFRRPAAKPAEHE
jgi:hypothetical protein